MANIKTIAHIADIHFRNYQRHDEYRAVFDNFFDKMSSIRPDRIVIAGDVVHSRNVISPELVNEVSWFLSNCSKVTDRVIMIPGNHDIVEQNKERMDAITPIINALDTNNIDYFTKSGVYVDNNVAWMVYSIYDSHAKPEGFISNDKVKIGLYHGILKGATNNIGFVFSHGIEFEEFEGCDIVLCGDIHKRQVIKAPNGIDLIMPGSFIQQNYSENISEHGFNLLEISDSNQITYQFYNIENPVKYLNFKISDFGDIETNGEILTNA